MSQHELEQMITGWNEWLRTGSTAAKLDALKLADNDRLASEKPEPRCKVCGRINPCEKHGANNDPDQ